VVALADDDQAPGEEGEDLTWTLPVMADPKRTRLQEMEDLLDLDLTQRERYLPHLLYQPLHFWLPLFHQLEEDGTAGGRSQLLLV
jgi:hypothetical protein